MKRRKDMKSWEEDDYRVVTSLDDLASRKLKLNVFVRGGGSGGGLRSKEGGGVSYGITADKGNKGNETKVLLFEESSLMGGFRSFVASNEGRCLWRKVLENSLYGLHFRTVLPEITLERLHRIFQQLTFETLICQHLKSLNPVAYLEKEIRLSKAAFDYQDLRNALAIYVAPFDRILALSNIYKRDLSAEDGGHEDRVHGIFPCRLSDIYLLQYSSRKDQQRFFQQQLQHFNVPESFSASLKIDIHFHVGEVIVPGVARHWSGVIALWRELFTRERQLRSGSASTSPDWTESLSLLVTYYIKKSGKKIEIDVPGGKRDLGETPYCCMQREVWEEIGFCPQRDSQSLADYFTSISSTSSSSSSTAADGKCESSETFEWMVWQQEEDPTFTSFVLCDHNLSTSVLLPQFSSSSLDSDSLQFLHARYPFEDDITGEKRQDDRISDFNLLNEFSHLQVTAGTSTQLELNRSKKSTKKKHKEVEAKAPDA